MMIVYSAESGKVALDGTGRNSPFTEALLRHIGEEGESISDMMIEVRNDVRKETGTTSSSPLKAPSSPVNSSSSLLLNRPRRNPPPPMPRSPRCARKSRGSRPTRGAVEVAAGAACAFAEEARRGDQAGRSARRRSRTFRPPAPTSRVIAVEPAGSGTNSDTGNDVRAGPSAGGKCRNPGGSHQARRHRRHGCRSRRRLKLARRPKRRCRQAPRAKSSRRTCLPSSSGSAAISAASTAIGAGARNLPLSASTGTPRSKLPLDEPQQASLDALKGWKGPHCPIEKAVPPRFKQRPVVAPERKRRRRARRCGRARPSLLPCKPCQRGRPRPQEHVERRAARATARLPVERLARPVSLAPNACVVEPGGACLGRQIDIAEIDENVAAHATPSACRDRARGTRSIR